MHHHQKWPGRNSVVPQESGKERRHLLGKSPFVSREPQVPESSHETVEPGENRRNQLLPLLANLASASVVTRSHNGVTRDHFPQNLRKTLPLS